MKLPLPLRSSLVLFGALLSLSTGCSAVSNRQVAWAAHEGAPLDVVVRRADAAEATTHEVDRLLRTPGGAADSAWGGPSTVPERTTATREMRAMLDVPAYAESHAKVVAAEVWAMTLAEVSGAGGHQQSLLGALNPKLADAYGAAMTHFVARRADRAQRTRENDVLIEARDAACKLPEADQKALGQTVSNLTQALDDAEIANRAAALGLKHAGPMSAESMAQVVRRIAADVVEDKTRVRPDLAALEVGFETTDGSVVLRGLRGRDLGAASEVEVTQEVNARVQAWRAHVASLGERLSANRRAIAFEREVLAQIRRGFNPNGVSDLPEAMQIPDAESLEVRAAHPAVHARARQVATQLDVDSLQEARERPASAPRDGDGTEHEASPADLPQASRSL